METTGTLAVTNLWQMVTDPPGVQGNAWSITNASSAARQFYRLRLP